MTEQPEFETTVEPSVAPSEVQPLRRPRNAPGFFSLIVGVLSLLACAYALTDGVIANYSVSLIWWLAGGALLTGLLLLASTLWPSQRGPK